jgi:peptidoglycan hydrolase-like protein with peptidoglycan-binding domain
MFDSIDAGELPSGDYAYASYVNGEWADYPAVVARFPSANVLSIAVSSGADADCLDIETGDATPSDAAAWYERQVARGVARPCLYADATTMSSEVVPVITAAGFDRSAVRLWSAHYAGEHICGPASCGLVSIDMDATQWTDSALGRDLDQSLLRADFFGPADPAAPSWETSMIASLPTLDEGADDSALPHWWVHRIQVIANGVFSASPQLAADGQYGPLTKAAVQAIQKQAGITEDGICGPSTWGVLLTGTPV